MLFAQSVQHIDVDNGLCTNSLTDLTLDHNGNMWIGSYNGLMKFSGTHIKCFTKIGGDPDAISGPEMHSVCEDQCGYIWIGTTAGLDKINPVTNEVEHYAIRSPFKSSSSVGYIYAVYADRYDFLWFSTDIALFRLDMNTGLYEAIPTNKDEHSVPFHTVLYNGFLEREDGLWISTGGGMAFFEFKTQLFFHRYHNPGGKSIFNTKRELPDIQSDLEADAQGKIWFIWEQEKLASYDIEADLLDTFDFEKPVGTWRCCWSIGVDAQENIWVGSRHGGVFVFNQETKQFKSLKDEGINRLIKSDYIYAIERGPDGQMFVAHDAGLDIIDLYDLSLREYRLSGRPDFLNLKYESGEMSFDASQQALFIPFYRAGLFKHVIGSDSFHLIANAQGNGRLAAFIYTHNGKEYLSTGGNLQEMEYADHRIELSPNYFLPERISDTKGEVNWCYVESPNSIYARKSSGKLFHIHDGSIDVLNGNGFKPNICLSPDSQVISYLNEDLDLVRIFLETGTKDTINLQQLLKAVRFSFSNPRHIADDGQSVWMTGQNGVLRYDYAADKLFSYNVNDGLSHSFTFSIVLDLKQNIWVGSLGGIDKYDKLADKFTSMYRIKDNTYMSAFGHALCSKKGELFFHFGNKLIYLNPESHQRESADFSSLRLNEVVVNGKNIDWTDPQRLHNLQHFENRFSFIYDVLLYDDSDLVTFEYRLNGGHWIHNSNRNEINLAGLASGTYLLEVRHSIGSAGYEQTAVMIPFHIRAPWWKQGWFITIVTLIISFGVWKYFSGRIEKFRKELTVTRQIAELESKALRAQMNPHFVFNSLNAIQECIVTGKVDDAYSYLSKFSKLLRMVLEHSDVSEVSLSSELEVLSLYVSLEKLRFRDDMMYEFSLQEDIDPEEIFIPPMLIQPHLENAIWHGLRFKEGQKKLKLMLNENPEGYLEVVIEDNGIGRKRAGELRESRIAGSTHKSKGTQLSANRMQLLSINYPHTAMLITDLYQTDHEPDGTKVRLTIPMVEKQTSGAHIHKS